MSTPKQRVRPDKAGVMVTAHKAAAELGRDVFVSMGDTLKGYGYVISDQRPDTPLYIVQPDGTWTRG